jgi:hypothetical protein
MKTEQDGGRPFQFTIRGALLIVLVCALFLGVMRTHPLVSPFIPLIALMIFCRADKRASLLRLVVIGVVLTVGVALFLPRSNPPTPIPLEALVGAIAVGGLAGGLANAILR